MERRIYIYVETEITEIVSLFTDLSDHIQLEIASENVIVLKDDDYYNLEPIDLESVHELIASDFRQDLVMVIEPYDNQSYPWKDELISFLPSLPKKVLYLEDIIIEATLKQNNSLIHLFRAYVLQRVKPDMLYTVRAFINHNMNSSLTAKNIYMHRNTVNYRIDHFVDSTHINVKEFKGASALYILFYQ
jgi:hypothetical protein